MNVTPILWQLCLIEKRLVGENIFHKAFSLSGNSFHNVFSNRIFVIACMRCIA